MNDNVEVTVIVFIRFDEVIAPPSVPRLRIVLSIWMWEAQCKAEKSKYSANRCGFIRMENPDGTFSRITVSNF